MQIPQQLPQFKKYPALFISSGEYEAGFFLAYQGTIKKIKNLRMAPREEAREKQAFVGRKGGMSSLSSVSHHGAYIAYLKQKFRNNIHRIIHDLIAEYKLNEIYLFAPRYTANRITAGLEKAEQQIVRMKFYKEYTKVSPLKMLEIFWQTAQAATRLPNPPNKTAEKILRTPKRS